MIYKIAILLTFQIFCFSAVILANDVCTTAVNLSVGNCVTFTNAGATASNVPTPALSCGPLTQVNEVDQWFTAIVPSSGNLTIQTMTINPGNPFQESVSLEVYQGNCNALTTLACSYYTDDYNSSIQDAIVELESLVPGSTVYIRAADKGPFFNNVNYDICVFDSGYTTHACKIQFAEAGPVSACDPITNTFSQDITIHYYENGTKTTVSVLGRHFPLSPSPMTITIEDLTANNNPKNVEILLRGNVFDECTQNSRYKKNDFFAAIPNCFSGNVVYDFCAGALDLNISDSECAVQIFDNTGATGSSSMQNCTGLDLPSDFQDVWFKATIPANGELIIATRSITTVRAMFDIYTGDCQNLTLIDPCNNAGNGARLTGRTPGEVVYIRAVISEQFSNIPTQGDFGICAINPSIHGDNCSLAPTVEMTSECIPKIYSTHFATNSQNPSFSTSCTNNTNPNRSQDMWFAIQVPSTGEFELLLDHILDSAISAELYEFNCNSLNSIDCQVGSYGQSFMMTQSGRIPNETLYLRVMSRGFFEEATFSLCLTSECPDTEMISFPINTQKEFEDHISITADNIIETNADVIYDAGQFVLLLAGFEVEPNAIFHALIDGCN